MSGRINSIDVVRSNPDIIYIGTASGGVWKSTSGGIEWTPIFDDQPIQSIGSIAIDPSNPSVVWAGTGEGNPRNSHNSGAGIYKTLDAGRSWNLMGLENTKGIHRIIVHPNDPNTIYAAATGSAWGPNPDRGVYRSQDGGETWESILFINDTAGCADLIIDPENPNKLYAAMWHHYRKPWFFTSGGEGSGLYVTHDGGDSWVERTSENGLPEGHLGRIGLAVSAANPQVVYALVEAKTNGLYKSTDGGFNFSLVSTKNIGNRPFYYADIYIDPTNENRLYNLYSLVSKSEDGGKSFDVILPYNSIHPDHHAFYIHPDNPSFLIDGNDGGMAISRDRGETWEFIETLPLAQFYHINIDDDLPYNIYGGMQDNGSWVGPSSVWQTGGIRNAHWDEVMFGDGFDVMPDQRDNRYGFAMYQGGNVYHYDRETGFDQYIQPVHPEDKPLRFNWNAPIAQDPSYDCTIYFGSQYLHRSTDCGQSWEIISEDLTSNDTAKQKQAQSGGLTIDATRAENYTALTAIDVSPKNSQVIWTGSDDGYLHVTSDGGQSWSRVDTRVKGMPEGAWIPFIQASPHDENAALLVVNDYRRNNWETYLFKTEDLGSTWTRIANSKQVQGHSLSAAWDPIAEDLIFLGTDHGLFFTLNGGNDWQKWTNGFPSTPARDMKIHPREHDLIVGTFGRAAWVFDDISPLRELSMDPSIADAAFYVFENLNPGYQKHIKPASGVRFTGKDVFIGENKRFGLPITCHIPELVDYEARKELEGEEEGQLKPVKEHLQGMIIVQILDQSGDTIRTFWSEADTGFNRVYWDMSRKGVNWPSHTSPKENKPDPSGDWVMPGNYTAVLTYDRWSASTDVEVKYDPRFELNEADLKARSEQVERIEAIVQLTTDAFERLKETEEKVAEINAMISLVEDSLQKDMKNEAKIIMDSVQTMKMVFMNREDFDGYDHVTQYLSNDLWHYGSYTYTGMAKPSPTADLALEILEKNVMKTMERMNAFYENEWLAYQKMIEEAEIPLFEDMEKLELKD